jgi:modulator of drug activity B
MSNILIINGAKKFAHSNGQLNDTLTEVADGYLRDAGHDVKAFAPKASTTSKRSAEFPLGRCGYLADAGLVDGRAVDGEKYIDDVFTEGHGSLYASDGRTRSDASKKYGSGGLIQGKNICSP